MKHFSVAVSMAASLSLVAPICARAQSSLRPSPVEVEIPKPPTPVMADGRRVFAYELHVTNLGGAPLGFRRVEIYADFDSVGSSHAPLIPLSDSSLRESLSPVDGGNSGDVTRLDVGKRTIVYVWLEQSPSAIVPSRLRHRLVFAPLDSTGAPVAGAESAIDSLSTPVLRDAVVPVLSAPVPTGVWLAGIGPSNTSNHRRALTALEGHGFISQRFAVDWVKVGPNGDTHHDEPNRNENFWAYGEPVFAVADGEVVDVVDGLPDNTPRAPLSGITIKTIAGNHLTLRIGAGQYVTYAHLKTGSIRPRVGQHVRRGDSLARLGNSGASTAPHLHLQVTDRASVLASEGIPFVLDAFDFLGFGRDYEPGKRPPVPRVREMPVADEVIGFRLNRRR
jgi:murein DD-endopeptidase